MLIANKISGYTLKPFSVIFVLILALGIFARTWEFVSLPPGLNQDEVSSAVDAYYVLHYGMDRNGVSYPIQFIMWGSGQSSLYEYILIPFIGFGLTPLTTRLPMLMAGILAMPLMYLAAKRIAGERYALIAMFLLAISPWHIMMTRWSLNDNMLPVIFLAGFLCVLKSTLDNRWFMAGCVFFAVCFYAYGAAYVAVPIFLLISTPLLLSAKKVSFKTAMLGFGILAFLSIPILLFFSMNFLGLASIHLGPFTIPRFPVQPRYESLSVLFGENRLQLMTHNLLVMLKVLIVQTDGLIWNSLPSYGYFYKVTFPLELIGLWMLITWRHKTRHSERLMVLAWILGALMIGLQIEVNINRINLIFMPLILCVAILLEWLAERSKTLFIASICAFLIAFAFFTRDYFGKPYRDEIGRELSAGFLPAMDFAIQAGDHPICASDKVNMPYIYALFAEKPNPLDYLNTVEYINPEAEFRQVRAFGRYTFGLQNCRLVPNTIYILRDDERLPSLETIYATYKFGIFNVYVPTNASGNTAEVTRRVMTNP